MEMKYIKKNGKIYLQIIEERETSVEHLKLKQDNIQAKADAKKAKLQKDIDKINSL